MLKDSQSLSYNWNYKVKQPLTKWRPKLKYTEQLHRIQTKQNQTLKVMMEKYLHLTHGSKDW